MLLKRHPVKDPARRIVTQGFGEHPEWYTKFGLKGHNGIDFGLPTGSEIQAVDDGTITEAKYDAAGFGYYLLLTHSWGQSLSAHLTQPPTGQIDQGRVVHAGDTIALSDNTGNSTGPHLHFGLKVNPCNRDDGWMGYSDPAPYLAALNQPTPPPPPPPPPPIDLELVRKGAWDQHGVPYNPTAALTKYARTNNLGVPLTKEFDVGKYRVQGFAGGIVYVVIGQWDQIKHTTW
jgi:murein DD-endopeptidase MepM/ murein hydrolase activator NlpD